MFVLKVTNTVEDLDKPKYNLTHTNTYGTRIEDKDISLGAVDAYRLHAVYESNDDNDPVIPSVTLVEPVFFATGSIVTGKTSNARAKVVDFSSGNLKLTVVYESGQFQAGETLSGFDSNNTAINAIINDSEGSVVAGSKVITGNFFLEVNQTPFIYDISKITRKKGVAKPIRKLKVVFDYYTHSATGDYFGGQSYLNTTYDDIPFFGVNFLADFLDFRPSVKNLTLEQVLFLHLHMLVLIVLILTQECLILQDHQQQLFLMFQNYRLTLSVILTGICLEQINSSLILMVNSRLLRVSLQRLLMNPMILKIVYC